MIYDSSTYEPWSLSPTKYLECLKEINADAWISPAAALQMLIGAQAPMGNKGFLAWRAGRGSLASIAQSVEDGYADNDDITRYVNVPLSAEWELEDWQSEHADMWHDGSMRMTRAYAGTMCTRKINGILFERNVIEQIAERWAIDADEPSKLAGVSSVKKRWPDEQMAAAISVCPISNRDKAWKTCFRDQQSEHGWTATDWRNFWSEARGTQGLIGRPIKRA